MRALAIVAFCFAPACPLLDNTHRRLSINYMEDAKLTVIATASRPETQAWCADMGAHHVIDHRQPLADELRRIGHAQVNLVASLTATEQHYAALVEALCAQAVIAGEARKADEHAATCDLTCSYRVLLHLRQA